MKEKKIKKDIKKDILNKIENKEVRMKPKWRFTAKVMGLNGAWLITGLTAALGVSIIVYFLQEYNPFELYLYGDVGWTLLREDFPYIWLLAVIILIVGGTMLESQIGNNYKRNGRWLLLITTAIIVGFTLLMILGSRLLQISL